MWSGKPIRQFLKEPCGFFHKFPDGLSWSHSQFTHWVKPPLPPMGGVCALGRFPCSMSLRLTISIIVGEMAPCSSSKPKPEIMCEHRQRKWLIWWNLYWRRSTAKIFKMSNGLDPCHRHCCSSKTCAGAFTTWSSTNWRLSAQLPLRSHKHTMNLCFRIWLTVNLWLRWNKTTHRCTKGFFNVENYKENAYKMTNSLTVF